MAKPAKPAKPAKETFEERFEGSLNHLPLKRKNKKPSRFSEEQGVVKTPRNQRGVVKKTTTKSTTVVATRTPAMQGLLTFEDLFPECAALAKSLGLITPSGSPRMPGDPVRLEASLQPQAPRLQSLNTTTWSPDQFFAYYFPEN